MLARVRLQQIPKVGAAGRQDDLVGCERATVAGQGDVHEVLLVPQVPEGGQYGGVEVVPSQRVLLLWGGLCPHWALGRCNFYANDYAVRYTTALFTRRVLFRSLRRKFRYLPCIYDTGVVLRWVVFLVENFDELGQTSWGNSVPVSRF